VADTYTRADSTVLGTTEVGGVGYEEFNARGGSLNPGDYDVARIEGGRIHFVAPANAVLPTDPAEARLSGIGFDLDVTAEVRFFADDYNADNATNAVIYTFRQGMDPSLASVFTKGSVHLIILPNGTYIIQVVTVSGHLLNGPPFPTILVPVNLAPIGPAFLATDTNLNGILESDEPFTLRGKIVGNVFSWFMNGVQIGDPLILPDDAITGVVPGDASNFIFGRTRTGNVNALEVAFDDLCITAPDGACATPPVEVSIDIKPGSDPNSINPRSKGVIPVAILTTDTFDASTVDPSTVEFGPNGATEAHGQGHLEDVDGDGDLDLVLHFRTQDTGIQCGDTEAILTGQTFGGQAIQGTDAVNTVGCH
jgi:hypothetical protein